MVIRVQEKFDLLLLVIISDLSETPLLPLKMNLKRNISRETQLFYWHLKKFDMVVKCVSKIVRK